MSPGYSPGLVFRALALRVSRATDWAANRWARAAFRAFVAISSALLTEDFAVIPSKALPAPGAWPQTAPPGRPFAMFSSSTSIARGDILSPRSPRASAAPVNASPAKLIAFTGVSFLAIPASPFNPFCRLPTLCFYVSSKEAKALRPRPLPDHRKFARENASA